MSEKTGRRRKLNLPEVSGSPHEEFVARVGEAIKRERLSRGLTQVQLAEAAELAHRIASALGVDVATLSPPMERGRRAG